MRLTEDVSIWLQQRLCLLAREDLSMVNMVLGTLPSIPNYTPDRWQFGADMIYRCIKSDLIAVCHYVDSSDEETLLMAVQQKSPFARNGHEGGFLWNGTLLSGTKRLAEVVLAHFPDDDYRTTINPGFIEAIEAIFVQSGVALSSAQLLPIRP